MVQNKVDLPGIVIHKCVPTHGIYIILRFCPLNPAPGAAPARRRPAQSGRALDLATQAVLNRKYQILHYYFSDNDSDERRRLVDSMDLSHNYSTDRFVTPIVPEEDDSGGCGAVKQLFRSLNPIHFHDWQYKTLWTNLFELYKVSYLR